MSPAGAVGNDGATRVDLLEEDGLDGVDGRVDARSSRGALLEALGKTGNERVTLTCEPQGDAQ